MDNPLEHTSFTDLESAITDQHAKLQASHDQFGDYMSRIQALLGDFARDLDTTKSNAETWSAISQERIQALKQDLAGSLGSSEEAQARIAELEEALATQTENGHDMQQKLENFQEEHADQVAAFEGAQRRVGALEKELEDSKAHTGQSEATLAALTAELDAARSELKALHPQLEGFQSVKADLEQQLQAANDESNGLSSRAETAESAQTSLTQALEDTRAELQALQDAQQKLVPAEKIEELKMLLKVETERADRAEEDIKNELADGTKATLAQQLAKAIEEAEAAKAQLRETQQQLGEKQKEKPQATSEEKKLVVQLKETDGLPGKRRSIGLILSESGIITEEQLEAVLAIQEKVPQKHLGAILIEEKYASEDAVSQALACQCSMDFIHLREDTVDAEAAALLNERLAQQHMCIPISATEDALVLAMANPMDLVAIEDIERATERQVKVVVSTQSAIKTALERFYWEPV
jgi:uncharacterized protein YhaN